MTMTFVVMGLGTALNAVTNRRDPASGLNPPLLKALVISLFTVVMIVLATQLPVLQSGLLTQSLSGREWLACIGLALLLPLVIEGKKWLTRRAAVAPPPIGVPDAVAPPSAATQVG
jgi:Ca2+-transporting ATPase